MLPNSFISLCLLSALPYGLVPSRLIIMQSCYSNDFDIFMFVWMDLPYFSLFLFVDYVVLILGRGGGLTVSWLIFYFIFLRRRLPDSVPNEKTIHTSIHQTNQIINYGTLSVFFFFHVWNEWPIFSLWRVCFDFFCMIRRWIRALLFSSLFRVVKR